jgi:hypothetical protein
MKFSVDVTTQGPLFTGMAAREMKKAVQGGIRELVQKGEQRLAEQLRPRPAGVYLSVAEAQSGITRAGKPYSNASTGNYRRNISTKFKSMGAIVHDGGVVYGPWLEGLSSRNDTTRFKGYGVYRKTASELQKISRGIMEAHARRWARKMNA